MALRVGYPLSRRALIRSTGRLTSVVIGGSILNGVSAAAAWATPPADVNLSTPTLEPPTFYVSATGDDSADGRTPQTAWSTIQKVNVALPADRSTVLFRRDETFYGELAPPFGCEVGAYGTGEKPILTMYKLLDRSEGWIEHATGVWQIDLSSPDTHDGYTATNDANIGYLVVDGTVKPNLKFSLSDLSAPWDFFSDIANHTLYVQASANPAALAANIKAAPNGNAYGASGTIIYCQKGANDIHDVHLTGSGGCGIRGSGPDVQVHECLIDYVGGSCLLGSGDGTTRYGNAIENWSNATRWTVANNEIAQIYDAAWSPQGRAREGNTVSWVDLAVRGNYIHDCGQVFELWSENDNPDSIGFVRVVIEENLCERGGYGVFSDARPNQQVRVHLLTYNFQTPVDVTIQNNIFDDAYGAYSYHASEPPTGFVTRNNEIRLKPGHKIQLQRAETVEQFAAWQAATGREVSSIAQILV